MYPVYSCIFTCVFLRTHIYLMSVYIYMHAYICLYYTYTHSHTLSCDPQDRPAPLLPSSPIPFQLCSGGAESPPFWGIPVLGHPNTPLITLRGRISPQLCSPLTLHYSAKGSALPRVQPPPKCLLPYFNIFCCFYYHPPSPPLPIISFLRSPLSFLPRAMHSLLKVHHIHLYNDFTRCGP